MQNTKSLSWCSQHMCIMKMEEEVEVEVEEEGEKYLIGP